MISDTEYAKLKEIAWQESEDYLNKNGYFFSDSYTDVDLIMFEELIWKAAMDYTQGNLSSQTFNVICSDYEGNPVYYNLSDPARDLIYNGLNLDYYKYIKPDEEKLLEINNNIKKLVIFYFGKL